MGPRGWGPEVGPEGGTRRWDPEVGPRRVTWRWDLVVGPGGGAQRWVPWGSPVGSLRVSVSWGVWVSPGVCMGLSHVSSGVSWGSPGDQERVPSRFWALDGILFSLLILYEKHVNSKDLRCSHASKVRGPTRSIRSSSQIFASWQYQG